MKTEIVGCCSRKRRIHRIVGDGNEMYVRIPMTKSEIELFAKNKIRPGWYPTWSISIEKLINER